MTNIEIEISDEALSSGTIPELSQTILLASAQQLYREEKLSSEQAARLAQVSPEDFFKEFDLPDDTWELTAESSFEGSSYLARVLWALELVERQSLPAPTAAEIAKFVSANSEVQIEETNTARFFRDCRRNGKFEKYWSVEDSGSRRRYTLSEAGKELLQKQ